MHEGYAQLVEGKSAAIATGKFASGARKMLPKDLFLDGFTNSKHMAIVRRGYDQSLMAVAYLQRAGTVRQFRTFLAMVGGGVGSDEALLQVYRFDVDQMLKKAARKSWR